MTSPIKVRGYLISAGAAYLRDQVGPEKAKQIIAGFSAPLRDVLAKPKPVDWYPVEIMSELTRAIGTTLGGNDEARVRTAMINCGRFMANEATNTFLRLFMRVLSPALFAKKIPDLWARDCSAGKFEVQVDDKRFVARMTEIEGFDHAGPIAVGFVSFSLEATGKPIESTMVAGWSLASTSAPTSFELIWKN